MSLSQKQDFSSGLTQTVIVDVQFCFVIANQQRILVLQNLFYFGFVSTFSIANDNYFVFVARIVLSASPAFDRFFPVPAMIQERDYNREVEFRLLYPMAICCLLLADRENLSKPGFYQNIDVSA